MLYSVDKIEASYCDAQCTDFAQLREVSHHACLDAAAWVILRLHETFDCVIVTLHIADKPLNSLRA